MAKLKIKPAVWIISVVFLSVVIGAWLIASMPPASLASADLKVVIDAGHGGIDGGVTGVNTGVKESELNLAVAKKLAGYFESAGVNAVLTRENSSGLYGSATNGFKKRDMQKRRDIINKTAPELVISVHMNKYSVSTRRGAQVFYDKNSENGKLLALMIQRNLNAMEESVRDCAALVGDYYILNSHAYPACIVECGFLSNPEDEKLLTDAVYQDKIAYAVFKGAIEYLTEASSYGFSGEYDFA